MSTLSLLSSPSFDSNNQSPLRDRSRAIPNEARKSSTPLPTSAVTIKLTDIADNEITVSVDSVQRKIFAQIGNTKYEVDVTTNNKNINRFIIDDNVSQNEMLELIEKVCKLAVKKLLSGTPVVSVSIKQDGESEITANGNITKISNRTNKEVFKKYNEVSKNPLSAFQTYKISSSVTSCLPKIKTGSVNYEQDSLIHILGDGNCGPLAIYNQNYQVENQKNNDAHATYNKENDKQQKIIRTRCARYLIDLTKKQKLSDKEENIVKNVIDSLINENPATLTNTSTIKGKKIAKLLEKAKTLNPNEKKLILLYRASMYNTNSIHVSNDFFEVYAYSSGKSIAIVHAISDVPAINTFYSESEDSPTEDTLFIFHTPGHYESINRKSIQGKNLINYLILRHEVNNIQKFIECVQRYQFPLTDDQREEFRDNWNSLSDEAYEALDSLLPPKTGTDSLFTRCVKAKDKINMKNFLDQLKIIKKGQASIHSFPSHPKSPSTLSPESLTGGLPRLTIPKRSSTNKLSDVQSDTTPSSTPTSEPSSPSPRPITPPISPSRLTSTSVLHVAAKQSSYELSEEDKAKLKELKRFLKKYAFSTKNQINNLFIDMATNHPKMLTLIKDTCHADCMDYLAEIIATDWRTISSIEKDKVLDICKNHLTKEVQGLIRKGIKNLN